MRDVRAKPAVSTLKTVHTNYFLEGVSTRFPLCCQHSHRLHCRRALSLPLAGNARHPISIFIQSQYNTTLVSYLNAKHDSVQSAYCTYEAEVQRAHTNQERCERRLCRHPVKHHAVILMCLFIQCAPGYRNTSLSCSLPLSSLPFCLDPTLYPPPPSPLPLHHTLNAVPLVSPISPLLLSIQITRSHFSTLSSLWIISFSSISPFLPVLPSLYLPK